MEDNCESRPNEWEVEPNEFEFEAEGFSCVLQRNMVVGVWCGYVKVPKTHPLHGKTYKDRIEDRWGFSERPFSIEKAPVLNLLLDAISDPEMKENGYMIGILFDVHGGITYSSHPYWESSEDWVFGFDCNHDVDFAPYMYNKLPEGPTKESLRELAKSQTYRTLEYAKSECEKLARQLSLVCIDTGA